MTQRLRSIIYRLKAGPAAGALLPAAMLLMIAMAGCVFSTVDSGGSTETGNTISGRIAPESNQVGTALLSGMEVRLLKADHAPTRGPTGYAAVPLLSTTTDSMGDFSLHPVAPGVYNLEIRDVQSQSAILFDSVVYQDAARPLVLEGELELTGSISGSLPQTVNLLSYNAVYIPGTTVFSTDLGGGVFTLENVPPGNHRVKFRSTVIGDDFCDDCVNGVDFDMDTLITVNPGQSVILSAAANAMLPGF